MTAAIHARIVIAMLCSLLAVATSAAAEFAKEAGTITHQEGRRL